MRWKKAGKIMAEKGYLVVDTTAEKRVEYISAGASQLLGPMPPKGLPTLPDGIAYRVEPLDGNRVLWILFDTADELATLRAANRQLQSALASTESASEAKNTFLSNMSHDIRTPMNAIVGMTTIALAHIDERSRVLDCLKKIQTASTHLMSLINDVLDMSHIESGKMTIHHEIFSLPDLLHDLAVIVRPQALQKNQTLRFEIQDIRFEELIGDLLRVRQIFVNIIGNAVKYTSIGGNILVTLREKPGQSAREIILEFSCQDNGIGMSEEFLSRIFLPFERESNTTQSKIEGTGLGMAIVHSLVEQMHGTISITSHLGKGSLFTVSIPFEARATQDVCCTWAGDSVLVVEQKPEQIALITAYLKDGGLTPTVVGGSLEAVSRLTEALYEGKPPCAVLLGEDLGGASPLDVAAYLRQLAGKNLPILLVSETDWPQIEYRAVRAGINAFIPCPLFRTRLLDTIRRLTIGTPDIPAGGLDRLDYSGKCFLLVEDNLLNQEITTELLSETGASIDTADNGAEAVRMFENSPSGHYDLILMDIQMPVMNGYEATRRIRALNRDDAKTVCIVAMTANVFMEDVQLAREAGMDDHLPKPVDIAKIEGVLQKYLT